jgi:hypothetical protein
MNIFKLTSLIVSLTVLFISQASAQNTSELEGRVDALEKYVDNFQPTLNKFSSDIQNSIGTYGQGLEANLNKYYLKLQSDLNDKLSSVQNRAVVLDLTGKKFQRIDTDAGVFLISVEKLESTEDGYKLIMNIGNINFADYKDYSFKLTWGKRWTGNPDDSYAAWKNSLTGAEFSFQGTLIKGVWNQVKLDLPVKTEQIEYLECEMQVSSVLLEYK